MACNTTAWYSRGHTLNNRNSSPNFGMKSRMGASNRIRKIRQKETTSYLTLGVGQCKSSFLSTFFRFLTSLVRVFLVFFWSSIFHFYFFHHVPCDLKQCSIRVNVMAWHTVSTAGTNGSSKHYHVMGIFLPGSCSLPVFNFFPFGLFV